MYAVDTYTEQEFELMAKIFPKYKRFKIIKRDEEGRLIFACKLLGEDNQCTKYKSRLSMCKKYPHSTVHYGGKLPDGCGYRVILDKSFEDYLR